MAETPDRVGPTALTTSSQTIVTAGALNTWTIIRKLIISNTGSTPVEVTLGIGTSNADTAAKRVFPNITVQPGTPWIEEGYLVLKGHGTTPDLLYALTAANIPSGTLNIYVATYTGP